MTTDEVIAKARDEIASHMDAIVALFKPGVKITVLVRTPSHPDGSRDMVMTDDIIDEAVAALLRRGHDNQKRAISECTR